MADRYDEIAHTPCDRCRGEVRFNKRGDPRCQDCGSKRPWNPPVIQDKESVSGLVVRNDNSLAPVRSVEKMSANDRQSIEVWGRGPLPLIEDDKDLVPLLRQAPSEMLDPLV